MVDGGVVVGFVRHQADLEVRQAVRAVLHVALITPCLRTDKLVLQGI